MADEEAPRFEGPSKRPVGQSVDELEDLTNTNRMRDYYAKQKKVSIKTREDEWVQVNGYTFVIKGGERVEVPEDIALLLEEAGRI